MAVMQTPQGRVIGLILKEDQPKPAPKAETEEKKPESTGAKRGGRTAKKV